MSRPLHSAIVAVALVCAAAAVSSGFGGGTSRATIGQTIDAMIAPSDFTPGQIAATDYDIASVESLLVATGAFIVTSGTTDQRTDAAIKCANVYLATQWRGVGNFESCVVDMPPAMIDAQSGITQTVYYLCAERMGLHVTRFNRSV